MQVLILPDRTSYEKLTRRQIQDVHFLAYGLDDVSFLVVKNRITGEVGRFTNRCISSFFNVTWS